MIVEVKVKDGGIQRHDATGWYAADRYFQVSFKSAASRIYPWHSIEWVFAGSDEFD